MLSVHISNGFKCFLCIDMLTTCAFSNLQGPVRTGRRKVYTKKIKKSVAMAPGDRQSKRVRSIPPTEVSPATGTSTRILKRLQTSAPHAQEDFPATPIAKDDFGDANGNNESTSPLRD